MKRILFLVILLLSALKANAQTVCSPSTTVSNCVVGQSVSVISGPANVRNGPASDGSGGTILGTQPTGATGKVMASPIPSNSTWQWYSVQFTSGVNGWVGGDNLKPGAITTPPVNALANFSCTPSFAPVTLSSFVPSGATGLMFVIQNPGVNNLVITGANVPAPFALLGNTGNGLPATIVPGASLPLTVKFIPTAVGTFNGNIVFSANVQGGSFLMGVTGVAK